MPHRDQEAVEIRSHPRVSLCDLREIGALGGLTPVSTRRALVFPVVEQFVPAAGTVESVPQEPGAPVNLSGVVNRRVLFVTIGVMQYTRAEIGNGERPVAKKLFLQAQVPILRSKPAAGSLAAQSRFQRSGQMRWSLSAERAWGKGSREDSPHKVS